MNDHGSNCIVLISILGSCLSDINKLMPLWYYGIILPEAAEECSLYSLLNLTIVELRWTIKLFDIILLHSTEIVILMKNI